MCRYWGLGTGQFLRGELAKAAAQFHELMAEAEADRELSTRAVCQAHLGHTLAWMGDPEAAQAAASAALEAVSELGGLFEALCNAPLAVAHLAAGDVASAVTAGTSAAERFRATGWAEDGRCQPDSRCHAGGAATWLRPAAGPKRPCRWQSAAIGRWRCPPVLVSRPPRVSPSWQSATPGEALAMAAATDAHLITADALERLAGLLGEAGSHREAARLFGAAEAVRKDTGAVRFKILRGRLRDRGRGRP